jgi:hypothetical protein
VVEFSLDDDAVIQEYAAKTDFVINTASSDHIESIKCSLLFHGTRYRTLIFHHCSDSTGS